MAKFEKGHTFSKGRAKGSLNKKTLQRLEKFQSEIEQFDIMFQALDTYRIRLESGVITDAGLVNGFKAFAPYYLKTLEQIDINDHVDKMLSRGEADQKLADILNKVSDIKKKHG